MEVAPSMTIEPVRGLEPPARSALLAYTVPDVMVIVRPLRSNVLPITESRSKYVAPAVVLTCRFAPSILPASRMLAAPLTSSVCAPVPVTLPMMRWSPRAGTVTLPALMLRSATVVMVSLVAMVRVAPLEVTTFP
jgi:hypothetical protein